MRKTITFDDELEKRIEEYRGSKRPIPSFSNAVVELVKLGLEAKKAAKK